MSRISAVDSRGFVVKNKGVVCVKDIGSRL